MTDKLTDFQDTSDVSDAAIEWVLRSCGMAFSVETYRRYVAGGDKSDLPALIAARLIEAHRPDLLVDPVDAIVREILATQSEADNCFATARAARDGVYDCCSNFKAIKRAYLMGLEECRKHD